MVDESTLRLSFLAATFFIVSLFASWYRRDPLLNAIPTVGFSDPILSYYSALRFNIDGLPMLKYGYENARRGVFKIAGFRRWMVLISGPELVEDVRKAPDDVLSVNASTVELKYTLGLLETDSGYHKDVIRSKLTRNIEVTFKDVRDELIRTLDASIPVHGDDWVKVPVLETVQRVVSATSNRIFVGSPLCRDQGYLNLNLNFAINVVKSAVIIGMFPKPLKPIAAHFLFNLRSNIRQEMEYIRPMVEERFTRMEEFGDDWDDKPNDMLMWLMSEAKGAERTLENLATRMLVVNFVAIHTTSRAFTHVLYRLLSNPEYIEPLRHEVETVVAEEGWTKAGMDKMHKIDSFLRESLRFDAVLALGRIVLRPFTLSNGVTVPAGTLVVVPSAAVHMDEEFYPNPEEFDGFRFAKLRERDGVAVAGHQATSTSTEYLAFGHGRHACPGRFFAANVVKALLAHVVVTYDIKFAEGQEAPRSFIINSLRMPGKAEAMFRKRQK
ncbi:cytochrome P450 [Lactarius akahatsu]|uniref:Cytochrome P450 n=1 Tax=Lactarius akahatsu TaxID=416441 RepID=A0AAD4LTR1_9AGAM|nr:cytochrome P450 [Lactarius akahatsu]